MPSLFTAEEAAAAQSWLARLPPQVLSRGHELTESDSVVSLEWDGEGSGLSASVKGGELYQLRLPLVAGRFRHSHCSCPFESNCKHAAAAVLAVLSGKTVGPQKAGKAPAAIAYAAPVTGLVAEAQTRAGKPLSGLATAALKTIETWWLAKKRTVPLADILRLSGHDDRWAKEHVFLYAKDDLPADIWSYLACVDTAVTRHNGKLPAPLPNLTDRKVQAKHEEALHREAALHEWKNRVSGWARTIPEIEPPPRPELRLRLTETGADIEWRIRGQESFSKITVAGLKSLVPFGMHSAEDVVLTLGRDVWGHTNVTFGSLDESLAKAVYQLLSLPQFRSALVGKSEESLTVHEEPLRWNLMEEASGDYLLHLVDEAGRTPPQALLIAGSRPVWFVTPEAAWRVEEWPFGNRTGREPMRIPAAALESTEGVTVLNKLGLPLPERFQKKLRAVPAKVTVQAKVTTPGEGRSAYLKLRARADFGDAGRAQWWMDHFWAGDPQSPKPPARSHEDEKILFLDKSLLSAVGPWLRSLEMRTPVSEAMADGWWERRITKDFPDVFCEWLAKRPAEVAVELDAELASLRDGVVSGTVRLSVEEAGMDWFDLRVALDVADLTLSAEEIQLLLKAQGRWVRIEGKGWRRLQFTLTPEQEAELAAMGLAVDEFDGTPQRLHALQLAGGANKTKGLLPTERADAVQRRAQEIQTRVQPEVPSVITATLRPYQLEGFHFLAYLSANRFGGVLADDMGLGKTLQTLTWIAWLRAEEELDGASDSKAADKSVRAPVLVVCPKSVQDNWRSEALRFCPGLRVTVWSRDDAGEAGLNGDADLLVIHYQQLRQHEEKLSQVSWLAVVLDEAQAIKNPTSQSARSASALQSRHRVALSGTPIENRLLDLWSIMGFAMPGVLGSRNHFAKHFDAKADPFARKRLAARVRPFLLRRTKKEVARDLPDRIEEDLSCELEGPQQKLYQAELKRARASLLKVQTSKQLDKARFHILTSLLRLRQICCHPALVLSSEDAAKAEEAAASVNKPKRGKGRASAKEVEENDSTGSAKLDALLELLEPIMEEGGKVLVFSQFVQMLELIRAELVARNWPHYVLTGQTDDRGQLVEQFQSAEGAAVFLISLKAGGSGLNLTAASYVVLVDPWWNPAVEAQAIDRTHRIGQKQKVNAYRLIVKDSIEEKIRLLQKSKSAMAHDILGEENFASSLTLGDFQFLLGEG